MLFVSLMLNKLATFNVPIRQCQQVPEPVFAAIHNMSFNDCFKEKPYGCFLVKITGPVDNTQTLPNQWFRVLLSPVNHNSGPLKKQAFTSVGSVLVFFCGHLNPVCCCCCCCFIYTCSFAFENYQEQLR